MAWKILSHMSSSTEGFGITTGTCSAACVYASALYWLHHEVVDKVHLVLPEGAELEVEVEPYKGADVEAAPEGSCWFRVQKDAGADVDVTDKSWVYGLVCGPELGVAFSEYPTAHLTYPEEDVEFTLVGGKGVGEITLEGLKAPVGEPAINPGPRAMITSALQEAGVTDPVSVVIAIPAGVELARKTFNPRLGIVNGISVLGTTGFVRPMSKQALVDALLAEVDVRRAFSSSLLLTFGASGEKAATKLLNISQQNSMQMSNFVGEVFDCAIQKGFTTLIIAGHPGKLVKLALGIMNTHSSEADGRAEAVITHAVLLGASRQVVQELYDAPTTEAMISILEAHGLSDVWNSLANKIVDVMRARAAKAGADNVRIATLFLTRNQRALGASDNLEEVVSAFERSSRE